jgi:hypothetical protein
MDKVMDSLLTALKLALADPGEQRLFRSGKLFGLFPGKSGTNSEAAARALRDGLLEKVRTETKGKTVIDWVKLTPRGVNFVHDQESPVQVLRELRAELRSDHDGVPAWLAQLRQDFLAAGDRLAEEVRKYLQRLDALTARVDEALRRAEAATPTVSDDLLDAVPWAADALGYLDRRPAGDCPLPELFAALREQDGDLSLTAFHEGLRRLHDRRLLRLVPFTAPPEQMPQPEHALLDGAAVFYHVATTPRRT